LLPRTIDFSSQRHEEVLRDAIAIPHRNVAPHRDERTVSTAVRVDWIL
jgi:hypothetical protein